MKQFLFRHVETLQTFLCHLEAELFISSRIQQVTKLAMTQNSESELQLEIPQSNPTVTGLDKVRRGCPDRRVNTGHGCTVSQLT
jgi:hypothetical protein